MHAQKRYLIVAWAWKLAAFGNVVNVYGEVLYDSADDRSTIPPTKRPGALMLLHRANQLCRQRGPVAIGHLEDGVFRPSARLARPLDWPAPRRDLVVPRCSLARP